MKQHANGAEFLKYDRGLEMGCGKGRNTVWLAEQGINMAGFDFSPTAISIARTRAKKKLLNNVSFKIMDATETWKYPSDHFDFIIDCFASVDIELGIEHVFNEVHRVLSPSGYFFMYTNLPKTEAYKEFYLPGSDFMYRYPDTGKVERTFSKERLRVLLPNFVELASEQYDRYNKYNGKDYLWSHLWLIYQKNK